MRTIAIINLKGGQGKTTTALNMSMLLAGTYKKKVLLVDNDIQANVTKFFQLHDYDRKSMEDIIREPEVDLQEIIRSTSREGLDIIPANMNLDSAQADLLMDTTQEQNTKLRAALQQAAGDYDFCVIDCPPGMGLNVINALTAAQDIMIPIKIDKNSLDGMEELIETIEEIKPFNPNLQSVKCLITQYTGAKEELKGITAIGQKYTAFATCIPFSKKVNDWTFQVGKSLQEVTPRSAATRYYKKFLEEYLWETERLEKL